MPSLVRPVRISRSARVSASPATQTRALSPSNTIASCGSAGALDASEARYRRLFETAKDGIFILDAATGHIIDVNPFLVQLLGYGREDLVGRQLWELGPFHDIAAIETPTFIVHGQGRLPRSDASRQFAEEMRRLYKPVRYRAYEDECYYVRSTDGVQRMLADMLTFLDGHLKGEQPAG